MADILLSVGIDITSLKTARAQIGAELKSWKFPETEKVSPIDTKQLKNATQSVKDLAKSVEGIHPIKGAFIPEDQLKSGANEAKNAKKELDELDRTTALSKINAKTFGESISTVSSELKKYYSAIVGGKELTKDQYHRMKELENGLAQLSVQEAEATKGLKGLFHGLDMGRLLLWAVGWKLIYGAMNIVLQSLGNIYTTIVTVNEVITTSRFVNQEMGESFSENYKKIKDSLYLLASGTTISINSMAKAYQRLTYEGANTAIALAALPHIRDLMIITGEKEDAVTQALIETYGLFGDKVKGAYTENEKFASLANTMTAMFTKAHITLSEYQQIMSFIGGTAAGAAENFNVLSNMLIFADEQMLSGRRAGMALMETLTGLMENTKGLADNFAITFRIGEKRDLIPVLLEMKRSLAGMNDEAKKDLLSKMFKGASLEMVLKLLQQSEESIKNLGREAVITADKLAKIREQTHWLEIAIKGAFSIVVIQSFSKFIDGISRAFYLMQLRVIAWQKGIFGLTGWIEKTEKLIEVEVDAAEAEKERKKAFALSSGEFQYQTFLRSLPSAYGEITKSAEEYKKSLKGRMEMVGVSPEMKQQFAILEDTYNIEMKRLGAETSYSQLEALGVNKALLANLKIQQERALVEEEIRNIIKETTAKVKPEDKEKAINELIENRKGTVEDISRIMLSYSINAQEVEKAVSVIQEKRMSLMKTEVEERNKVILQMYSEIKSLADEIESKTVDFVKNLMVGTASVKDFMQSIIDAYRSAFAEQVGGMLADTGLFTGMAEVFLSPIQKAKLSLETGILDGSKAGSKLYYDSIIAASSGAVQPAGAAAAPQAAGGISGFMQSISSMFGGGVGAGKKVPTAQTATVAPMAAAGGATQVLVKPTEVSKMAQAGQLAGKALGVAGALYGAYQGIAAQKGVGKGMGALGGALSGAMAGTMLLPGVGTVIGAVVGAIGGFFMGGKKAKAPDPEIRVQTQELKSAIQISNKELQIISRNTIGLRRDFEGYFMPRSTFFSERLGVEERFNLSRSRGIL